MLPALPDEVIFDEVVVTPRTALLPLPDLRRTERPGWLQIVTPSFKHGGFNEVAFSALADDEADAVIDAAIAEYRAEGIAFRWTVPPGSAPADLGERLARRGGAVTWTRGMARCTEPLASTPDPSLHVEEIDTSGIDVFTRVMAEGWSVDPAPLRRAHDIALGMGDARRHRFFLARANGAPAGVASYVAFPRSAYLLGAVVLPAYRGRGLYGALVDARLADARARGLQLATSHARETSSAPILERLGFATICRFPVYSWAAS